MNFQDIVQRVTDDIVVCLEESAKHLRQAGTIDETFEVMCNTKKLTDTAISEFETLRSYSILKETYEFKGFLRENNGNF